ncbi:MAG: hypothetical protein ABSC53_15355 [Bacteroidota bacterium]|jgi:hypothetical protein
MSNNQANKKDIKIFFVRLAKFIACITILTIVYYWKILIYNFETILCFTWLFIIMVAGMLVQVISSNYHDKSHLLNISISQLVYPILFSIITFYPLWAYSTTAPINYYSFYSAFMNGFFWKTVVSSSKPPS